MDPATLVAIAVLMGLAAALYTSVGHAGASAYLAIMALFAVAPETMRPTALVLNIIVASLATFRFARAGQINWRLLLLCVAGAVPAAFVAGGATIPGHLYRPLVGVVLWIAAVRMFWPRRIAGAGQPRTPSPLLAVLAGAGVGALSGLTGTGGGIFLSPIILFAGWEGVRRTSGTAAGFILCVSAAGLAGNLGSVGRLPAELPWFALAVVLGALVGTRLGVSRLPAGRLLQALGAVLLIAGAKLIFT
ncbi:MAG: sulfite exporter TauE/SafE family protein [Sphingomonas sp.]|uniref:sulfite exporter TauE/SafE family protein n=1 Tax=Sphingomonas sp. TaxID=28214 RepID=UPI001B24F583|nr:sulfite exporter TauE/SafE family protein [Sphingomonas sp.]MBO9623657.1 sulfite exporter TauE/SafE family protein [Sphingomonas sp.]